MVYDFIGTVKQIHKRSGMSQKGPWEMWEAVIEHDTTGQYPRRVLVSVWDEQVYNNLAICYNNGNSGVIKVTCSIDSRENNGRWYNDIRAFRADPQAVQGYQAQPQAYQAPAAPNFGANGAANQSNNGQGAAVPMDNGTLPF